jgi:cytidine deaminase
MAQVSDKALIDAAADVLNPRSAEGPFRDQRFGFVASTLVTDSGNLYSGVSIDTGSGTGFCAEHAAVAAMITAGEYRIAKIVAVWRDKHGGLQVLAPCGRCREFMLQVDAANLQARVVLGLDRSASLADLLPEREWPRPQT